MKNKNNREDDIKYLLEGDFIYSPNHNSEYKYFKNVLIEILKRLPDNIFYEMSFSKYNFIVDWPSLKLWGINCPLAIHVALPKGELCGIHKINTILIFRSAFKLPKNAFIGLIVHEIAHSFISDKEPAIKHEQLSDEMACKWRFVREIKELLKNRIDE